LFAIDIGFCRRVERIDLIEAQRRLYPNVAIEDRELERTAAVGF